jgi:hypothetical protein
MLKFEPILDERTDGRTEEHPKFISYYSQYELMPNKPQYYQSNNCIL